MFALKSHRHFPAKLVLSLIFFLILNTTWSYAGFFSKKKPSTTPCNAPLLFDPNGEVARKTKAYFDQTPAFTFDDPNATQGMNVLLDNLGDLGDLWQELSRLEEGLGSQGITPHANPTQIQLRQDVLRLLGTISERTLSTPPDTLDAKRIQQVFGYQALFSRAEEKLREIPSEKPKEVETQEKKDNRSRAIKRVMGGLRSLFGLERKSDQNNPRKSQPQEGRGNGQSDPNAPRSSMTATQQSSANQGSSPGPQSLQASSMNPGSGEGTSLRDSPVGRGSLPGRARESHFSEWRPKEPRQPSGSFEEPEELDGQHAQDRKDSTGGKEGQAPFGDPRKESSAASDSESPGSSGKPVQEDRSWFGSQRSSFPSSPREQEKGPRSLANPNAPSSNGSGNRYTQRHEVTRGLGDILEGPTEVTMTPEGSVEGNNNEDSLYDNDIRSAYARERDRLRAAKERTRREKRGLLSWADRIFGDEPPEKSFWGWNEKDPYSRGPFGRWGDSPSLWGSSRWDGWGTRLPSPNEQKVSSILKRFVDEMWAATLRDNSSSHRLMTGILNFNDACQRLRELQYDFDFVTQRMAIASKLHESLGSLQADYSSFDSIGLALSGFDFEGSNNLLRYLFFLELVYREVTKVATLDEVESDFYEKVREWNAIVRKASAEVTNYQLGFSFFRQLTGPLSRKYFREKFPGKSAEGVDYEKVGTTLRQGKLNHLILMGRLPSYLRFLLTPDSQPQYYITPTGDRSVVEEEEPQIEGAQDLTRFRYFIRRGESPEAEMVRMVQGDMKERVHHEPETNAEPVSKRERHSVVLIYDYSSSMAHSNKYVVQYGVMGTFLDDTQNQSALGQTEYIYHSFGFDVEPHPHESARGFTQTYDLFSRTLDFPAGAGADTDITGAMVKAYELIAEDQKEGGDLSRATIILITDGIDSGLNVARIAEGRKKIDPSVNIRVNVINLEMENPKLRDIARAADPELEKMLGVVSYRFIPSTEITELTSASIRLKILEDAARFAGDPASNTETQSLLSDIGRAFTALGNQHLMASIHSYHFSELVTIFNHRLGGEVQLQSRSFDELIQSFITFSKTPLLQDMGVEGKARILMSFLDSIAREYTTQRTQVLSNVSDHLVTELRAWLGLQ